MRAPPHHLTTSPPVILTPLRVNHTAYLPAYLPHLFVVEIQSMGGKRVIILGLDQGSNINRVYRTHYRGLSAVVLSE